MPLTPVEVPHFRGLDLGDDPQEMGAAAVDLNNVVFSPSLGRLATRPGTSVGITAPASAFFSYLAPHSTGVLIDGDDGVAKMWAYTATGTLITSLAHSGILSGYANFGTPTSTRTYMAMGDSAAVVRFDGTTLSTVATITNWNAMTLSTSDNRLVVGNHQTDRHKVQFSDPGAPETFGVNNYVDLTPGDGQRIVALATFQNQVYAFKSTKFFVFYATDVDGSGNPIFNYRTVDTGIGLVEAGSGSNYAQVAIGPDGVYFMGRDGVYVTSGGAPRLVLSLTPLIRAASTPYFTGTSTVSYPFALAYHDDRLYLSHSNAAHATAQTFVYDLRTRDLSLFTIPVGCYALVPSTLGLRPTLFFVNTSANTQVRYFDDTVNTDAGVAFTAKYRTSFWNPGKPGTEADVFEWLLDGTGTVTLKTAINDAVTLGAGQALTLGTAPATAQSRDGRAVWGRNISVELSGTAPWSVARMIANVAGQTDPGFKAS